MNNWTWEVGYLKQRSIVHHSKRLFVTLSRVLRYPITVSGFSLRYHGVKSVETILLRDKNVIVSNSLDEPDVRLSRSDLKDCYVRLDHVNKQKQLSLSTSIDTVFALNE